MRNRGGKWEAFAKIPGALVPTKRRTRKAKVGKTPEAVLQAQAEAYLDLLGVFYIRLPDSLMRTVFATPGIPVGVKCEVADCLKGIPDLILLCEGKYLAVELKREGGKMSAAQRDVQREIKTVMVDKFEDFKALVDGWLAGIPMPEMVGAK